MKLFNKLACAAAVTLAMAANANAGVVINNWVFNPAGTGFAAGTTINESLDVNGNAFIELSRVGVPAGAFNFEEHAVFSIGAHDGGQFFGAMYPTGNITATFEAVGTGTFNGAFSFSSGTIKLYQNPTPGQYATTAGIYGANLGTLIASFDVLPGGGGLVDGTGNPVGNGQVSVFAKATSPGGLTPGYFFRSNGTDLSGEDILSFAFTNANGIQTPTTTLVSEVACQFAQSGGSYCPTGAGYANAPGQYFFVGNNGQFKLAEVPEPGSLALFGIAMLGAGVVSRKRASKA